jgi:hypothetical protein
VARPLPLLNTVSYTVTASEPITPRESGDTLAEEFPTQGQALIFARFLEGAFARVVVAPTENQ